MAAKHGTRRRYVEGCRCDECGDAQRNYQRDYRERKAHGLAAVPHVDLDLEPSGPGPVESGVQAEISGLAAQVRPGLAQVALALARMMDDPKSVNQKAAAAKVLVVLLEKLRAVSARGRRGDLALVRGMTKKDGA